MLSHPSWVCGLKLIMFTSLHLTLWSHPSWVCGLKQVCKVLLDYPPEVTPFVGVWIETQYRSCHYNLTDLSHPSWVCGLKLPDLLDLFGIECHTLRGCVD